jgi:hypothetical protein
MGAETQNGGRRTVVTEWWAKEGMLPPIVCDRDAFIPLYGIHSRVYMYVYLYLLNIYIFLCVFYSRMLEWEPDWGLPSTVIWSLLSTEMLTRYRNADGNSILTGEIVNSVNK